MPDNTAPNPAPKIQQTAQEATKSESKDGSMLKMPPQPDYYFTDFASI